MKYKHICKKCGRAFESERTLKIHETEFHDLSIEAQLPGSLTSQIQQQANQKRVENNPGQVQEMRKVEFNLDRHIFISGQTQSGKSVVAKLIFASLKKSEKAIFYDYKHDPNHKRFIQHFPIFKNLSEIIKYFETDRKGFFGNKPKDMRVVYQPPRIETDVIKTHSLENPNWKRVNDLANYVYREGNIILFIDEIAPFTSSQALPPALYDCYIMGASRGVTVVSITQRPNVVHNTMISESYTRIIFRQELEADRIKLKGIIGADVAKQLHRLPNEIFIVSYINGDWKRGHFIIPPKFKYIL